MNSNSFSNESPIRKQPAGQLTIFHVFGFCGAIAGAALGHKLGAHYGMVASIFATIAGVPLGYYVGCIGSFVLLGALFLPRDFYRGIISLIKSGLSRFYRRQNN